MPGGIGQVDSARRLAEAVELAKPAACFAGAKDYIATMSDYIPVTGILPAGPIPPMAHALFSIGDVVRHRLFEFRGVVFDIDPVFANSEEWYEAIPAEMRPRKDQPFYHLLAENDDSSYVAYVSQQNLLGDSAGGPVDHPSVPQLFEDFAAGRYRLRRSLTH